MLLPPPGENMGFNSNSICLISQNYLLVLPPIVRAGHLLEPMGKLSWLVSTFKIFEHMKNIGQNS